MSEEVIEGPHQEMPAAERPEEVVVESPPRVAVVEAAVVDPRAQLNALAGEAAKRGSRKLLWEYLRLRSKVLGR